MGLIRIPYGVSDHRPMHGEMAVGMDGAICWSSHPGKDPGTWHGGPAGIPVQLHGAHQLANINAAIAVAQHFGVPPELINRALAGFLPPEQRGENRHHSAQHRHCRLLQRQSELGRIHTAGLCCRRHTGPLAILGDMKELGTHAASGHQLVRDVARDCGPRMLGGGRCILCARPSRPDLCRYGGFDRSAAIRTDRRTHGAVERFAFDEDGSVGSSPFEPPQQARATAYLSPPWIS